MPLAAASRASRTTSDNYVHHGHLGDFLRVDFPCMRVFTVVAMKTLKQQFNSAASGAIVQLRGRAIRRSRRLAERETRRRGSRWSASTAGCSPAHRGRGSWTRTPNSCGAACTLIARGLAAEGDCARHSGGIGRVCRIFARSRLPGARRRGHPPPPRRLARRAHAPPVFARLLDGARDPPWLPAEAEVRGKAQAGIPKAREHIEEADAAR